jgi:hypothetical protein
MYIKATITSTIPIEQFIFDAHEKDVDSIRRMLWHSEELFQSTMQQIKAKVNVPMGDNGSISVSSIGMKKKNHITILDGTIKGKGKDDIPDAINTFNRLFDDIGHDVIVDASVEFVSKENDIPLQGWEWDRSKAKWKLTDMGFREIAVKGKNEPMPIGE